MNYYCWHANRHETNRFSAACSQATGYDAHSARLAVMQATEPAQHPRRGMRLLHRLVASDTRVAHLSQVVNNHRFLLLPALRMANLASHVLGLAVRELAAARDSVHGERPC